MYPTSERKAETKEKEFYIWPLCLYSYITDPALPPPQDKLPASMLKQLTPKYRPAQHLRKRELQRGVGGIA